MRSPLLAAMDPSIASIVAYFYGFLSFFGLENVPHRPDYYDVISEPMDLNKLWKRCSACRYRTVEDFKRELALVASNCRLYCQDKFPSLPPAADAAVKVCMYVVVCYVCMYVCMCVYVCVYVCVCMCVYVCVTHHGPSRGYCTIVIKAFILVGPRR